MAYFLKKSKQAKSDEKGLYLQIYESSRDKARGGSYNKCFKSLGYYNDLISNSVPDPIEHYKEVIKEMNKERKKKILDDKVRTIGENPVRNIGYFIANNVMNKMDIKEHFNLLFSNYRYEFNPYESFIDLVYSRLVEPSSKLKAYEEVIPTLYRHTNTSIDQIYSFVESLGRDYERVVEILNYNYEKAFGKRKTDYTYFDCTNYYFEIDKPYEDKQKGPSKENRKDPIIGMGLLLDSELIPFSFKMYPGNQSEKPMIRQIINSMKEKNNIKGKTIQVADKGLNCGQNIYEALQNGDGYIYSNSVNTINSDIKNIVLDETGYVNTIDKNGDIVFRIKEVILDREYEYLDENGKKDTFKAKQKLVIYYSKTLEDKKSIEIKRKVDIALSKVGQTTTKGNLGSIDKYIDLEVIDKNGEITNDKIIKCINQKKIEDDLSICGYNILITSEIDKSATEIYDVYHKLWKIEETFRLLKTSLEARPIYHRNKESIYGHFLILFTSILLVRILEIKILNCKIDYLDILSFIRKTRCIISKDLFINISSLNDVISFINSAFKGKYLNYYLYPSDLDKMLSSIPTTP